MRVMKIRALRERIGLTQRALGASMGVDCSTVTKWETEVALPKARQLPLLAKVLGVPIGELFEDPDDPDMTNHITELGA